MRKTIVISFCFMLILMLTGCKIKTEQNDSEIEKVPLDYGNAVVVAQEELERIFSEYENLKITQTSTMVRTNDENKIVVQFNYTSENGSGIYGFEIEKTSTGSYDIIEQGENVTIDNLVVNQ